MPAASPLPRPRCERTRRRRRSRGRRRRPGRRSRSWRARRAGPGWWPAPASPWPSAGLDLGDLLPGGLAGRAARLDGGGRDGLESVGHQLDRRRRR